MSGRLERLVPTPESFTSSLRSPAVAARVGRWLGICFGVCFLTGLISHYAQSPSQPVPFPTSPAWGYRLTQGLHVVTGTAAVPLLLVKLWSVFPRLFERPSSRSLRRLALAGLEKLSIGVLVASAVFQLATGLANTAQWYPFHFGFRSAHYALAWIAIGALVLHIAVKLPVIRAVFAVEPDAYVDEERPAPSPQSTSALSRRGLLRATWLASGAAAIAVAGQSLPLLRKVSIFAVRTGDGPQGVPVNMSAQEAGVIATATDPGWRLTVTHGDQEVSLSREDLLAMDQHTESLPIACVEGWSAGATWTGVPVRDVLALVGAPYDSELTVSSFQQGGSYSVTTLQKNFAADHRTLLALKLHGEDLDLDHGFPCRLIAPDRPGVLQTKWLTSVEVRA